MESTLIFAAKKDAPDAKVIGSRPYPSKYAYGSMAGRYNDSSKRKIFDSTREDEDETSGDPANSTARKDINNNTKGKVYMKDGDAFEFSDNSSDEFFGNVVPANAVKAEMGRSYAAGNSLSLNGESRNKDDHSVKGSGHDGRGTQDDRFQVAISTTELYSELKRTSPMSGTVTGDKRLDRIESKREHSIAAGSPEEAEEKIAAAANGCWTADTDLVVPINSSNLYEELLRVIKEGERLKKNKQHCELRNTELRGEVVETARMAAHYEAKSDRGSVREEELRSELNAAMKRAVQSKREAGVCRKRVELLESMFVESEKRQSGMQKKLEEAVKEQNELRQRNECLEQLSIALRDRSRRESGAVEQNETYSAMENQTEASPVEEQYDGNEENDRERRDDKSREIEYENKEYRYLIDALKGQLNGASAINTRYAAQVKHQGMALERLKQEKTKMQEEMSGWRCNENGRKGKAFLYLKQYREAQVKMQSVLSELKRQRAENDELNIQCKWMKMEIERLRRAVSSKRGINESEDGEKETRKGDEAKAKQIEKATNLVEERMKLARTMSKSNEKHGHHVHRSDIAMEMGGNQEEQIASESNILKDQHEKLSIEMALTRSNVKKLESDNSELRQKISLLKAEMALGAGETQKDGDGGVIPGKYRRGNFEVVSSPAARESDQMRSRRTQSMSEFKAITGKRQYNRGSMESYDKAQSLIDLSKLSIDEIDEGQMPLRKHSSEGEMAEYYDENEANDDLNDVQRQIFSEYNAFRVLNEQRVGHGADELAENGPTELGSEYREPSIIRSMDEAPTRTHLHSTISFPHLDEISNFGNFKKIKPLPSGFHTFKVPGALRASPAAKSFNSFIYP